MDDFDKTSFPEIYAAPYMLRRFRKSDTENVFRGLSHPEVIRYYGVQYASLEDTDKQMRWFEELERNHTGLWWAICSLDNKIFYGAAGLNNISSIHRKGEIGFWLMPEFWNLGIMTRILPLICQIGFVQFNLNRIEGFVEKENLNCKRALQKLHFVHEGTMRECEIKNNRFIDLDIYSNLRSDNN